LNRAVNTIWGHRGAQDSEKNREAGRDDGESGEEEI